MNGTTKALLTNALPHWVSVILLALLAFGGRRLLTEFDVVRTQSQETRERIIAAEMQIKQTDAAMVELRVSQRDIILELKTINLNLTPKK